MNVRAFTWNGKQMVTREDWTEALTTILTPADATAFMHSIYAWYPGGRADAQDFVGYLTGDVPRPLSVKVRQLLRVRHPLNPDDVEEAIEHQFAAAQRIARLKSSPPWLQLAMSFERTNGSAFHRAEDVERAQEIAKLVQEPDEGQ
jgi:hypothetical protein